MRCDNVCEFYGRDGFCFKNNPNKVKLDKICCTENKGCDEFIKASKITPFFNIDDTFFVIHEKDNQKIVVESRIYCIYGSRGLFKYKINPCSWSCDFTEEIDITEQNLKSELESGTWIFKNRYEAQQYKAAWMIVHSKKY